MIRSLDLMKQVSNFFYLLCMCEIYMYDTYEFCMDFGKQINKIFFAYLNEIIVYGCTYIKCN